MVDQLAALADRLRLRRAGVLSPKKKAATLIEYGEQGGIPTFVETGTYLGQTVSACLGHFDRIFTIELDPTLVAAARKRFAAEPSVTVVEGDSSEELVRLTTQIEGRALFWLDAHYSAGVTAKGPHDPPLEWELEAILARNERDIVLIDDARLMGSTPGYPPVSAIHHLVGARAASFEVRADIIRISLDI